MGEYYNSPLGGLEGLPGIPRPPTVVEPIRRPSLKAGGAAVSGCQGQKKVGQDGLSQLCLIRAKLGTCLG